MMRTLALLILAVFLATLVHAADLKLIPTPQQVELRERCRSMLPAGHFTLTARAWAVRGMV